VGTLREEMRRNLPSKIQVSFFEISCQEMKEYLSEKYQSLEKNLIGMIAKKARVQSQALFNSYQVIMNKVKETPNDIEKLTEIEEYITNLPNELDKLRLEMNKCFEVYGILEGFNYRFGRDEL
jgi:dynein heavy chain, axonemal